MMKSDGNLCIGIIGLDTSHVLDTMRYLHDESDPWYIPGGRVVAAYPGGSPDFPSSISKIESYTRMMREEYGVAIVEHPAQVAEQSDAILLHSVDGRVHLSQFREIAPYGKPVFIDKPFAVSSRDAREMVELSQKFHVPLLSSSSLRYSEALREQMRNIKTDQIYGVDTFGTTPWEPTQPGFFWYGIHSVEGLYQLMGEGCVYVTTTTTTDHDIVTGVWKDGRIGTLRGHRTGNGIFGITIHHTQGSQLISLESHPKPISAGQLEEIMSFFRTGKSTLPLSETLEIIRFIEAANESKDTKEVVFLE